MKLLCWLRLHKWEPVGSTQAVIDAYKSGRATKMCVRCWRHE